MSVSSWDFDAGFSDSFPSFMSRPPASDAQPGRPPCNRIASRLGGLWGAGSRLLRWAMAGPQIIQFSEINMQNGLESQMAMTRSRMAQPIDGMAQLGGPQVGAQIGHAATPSDSAQALVAAIQRIRIIEGERHINRMLYALARESDQVMVANGAQAQTPQTAEVESLHNQLKRAQSANDNGRVAHQALQRAANELAQSMAEIATMGDSVGATRLRELAQDAVKTWEMATS